MRVLGIDPGPEQSAYCFWDGRRIDVGSEETRWLARGLDKNIAIRSLVREFAQSHDVVIAIEHLECFGMAVGKETFETAYWIGELRAHCKPERFVRVYRHNVKMHFCHSMKAKPANIRQALIDRFGGKGTKKNPGLFYGFSDHLWSAFAVACITFDQHRDNRDLL